MKNRKSLRMLFLRWTKEHIAKVPEGCVNPKWLTLIYKMLFPLNAMYERQSHTNYNFQTDVYTIEGIKIAGFFFRSMDKYAKEGLKYQFVKNDFGVITIKTLD